MHDTIKVTSEEFDNIPDLLVPVSTLTQVALWLGIERSDIQQTYKVHVPGRLEITDGTRSKFILILFH